MSTARHPLSRSIAAHAVLLVYTADRAVSGLCHRRQQLQEPAGDLFGSAGFAERRDL